MRDKYLTGEILYGDDFSPRKIRKWYDEERESHFQLGSSDSYLYHTADILYGFSLLPTNSFHRVLGIGSADGSEFLPIVDRIDQLHILESSKEYQSSNPNISYVDPSPLGDIPFKDKTFELVVCLRVLHHIPNVSHVVSEIVRCLKPGGFAVLCEPTISLGDWNKFRPGLTKRERGIPLKVFRSMLQTTGVQVVNEQRCFFAGTYKFAKIPGIQPFNSKILMKFDKFACWIFSWNRIYHSNFKIMKMRPTHCYFVVRRRADSE